MPVGAEKNKTKQCPYQERGAEDHTPPRLGTEERSFRFEEISRSFPIQNYGPVDSIRLSRFSLRMRSHVSTHNRMLDRLKVRVCSVVNTG
jgi:hypothetical protein